MATDGAMFEPALVTLASACHATSRRVVAHFIGQGLLSRQVERLHALCDMLGADVLCHELTEDMLAGGRQRDPNIALVTLARMYLPELVQGRVIYLDCDMLIRGDLSVLQDLDLGNTLIAAVRDFWVLHRVQKHGDADQRLSEHREVMQGRPVTEYFNAGLLVMDCEAIRAEPGLARAMLDFAAASRHRLLDQDRLNQLFRGRVTFLGPEWNEIWGRSALRRRVLAQLRGLSPGAARAQVLHYTGPHKPWKRMGLSMIFRGRLPAVLRYRLARARMRFALGRHQAKGMGPAAARGQPPRTDLAEAASGSRDG